SQHISDVQQYVIDKLNVPVVGHISDNVYAISPNLGIVGRFRSKSILKKVKRLISQCNYLEVFAENMAEEYSKTFSVPCYVIGKGVEVNSLSGVSVSTDNCRKKKFVYTGNINQERFNSLLKIGKALQQFSGENGAVLEMYSATMLNEKMKREINSCPCMQFKGKISKEEVDEVQKEADFLIHVEGFGPQAIFEAGMSFSTKIIDYMSVGKPIFAVGSESINSIRVLSNRNAAIVAKNEDDINTKIKELLNNEIDVNTVLHNAHDYLINERDIQKIQGGIKERLFKLFHKAEQ
ncbi:MAG: glycosyltransferase, partial [Clostridia bacterium]|nr:glycosyltransferase [Clostridia bacterium]